MAYSRIFKAGDYFDQASFGRAVTKTTERNKGIGHQLVKQTLAMMTGLFPRTTIKISAQAHLEKFYRQHGFVKEGEPYLEDNIPHIAMLIKKP